MVEEMQRATIRSLMDSMTVELEDEQAILTSLEWGFQEFGDSLRKEINIGNLQNSCNFNNNSNLISDQMQQLLKTFSAAINGANGNGTTSFDGFMQAASAAASNGSSNNNGGGGCPVTKPDSYLSLLKSVVQFSESIRGFQFLYKDDKVKLLKNSIFPVLLLRLASIKTSESKFLFSIQNNRFGSNNNSNNNNILQEHFQQQQNNCNNGKINSEIINDFIQCLRTINLDEKQMALFTALVITQADSAGAGGCNMAAAGGLESSQTNLIKLLQEKLWLVLQKTFFSSNAIDLTIKIQSMFSLLTDLKRINEMHEIRLKSFSFIGQLPPPPITTTVSAAPTMTNTTMPMPTSVISNNITNLMPSIIAPKKESAESSAMNGGVEGKIV
uniref:NR LBD domain-containing protein n=1 Tax=Panagrolaimus sp. ES5 TaxID=591445 RepID=A0AC34FMA8_9BILA